MFFSVDVAVESDRIDAASFVTSSCRLSWEEVDIRFAKSKERFVGVFSLSGWRASFSFTGVSSEDCNVDPRGVEGEEGGR